MGRVAYVNGRYLPHAHAVVHIEDRGFQFADSVYEYFAVFGGRLVDAAGHFERLWRSLDELAMAHPMTEKALRIVLGQTIRLNRVRDGSLYLQVTRGTAPRDHAFPLAPTPPSVVATAKAVDYRAQAEKAARGVAVVTRPDQRWARCDIKTTGLLPNVLAKQAARAAGAYEAWLVDDLGFITEGASTNAWIVDAEGALRTRDANANILRGVTRKGLMAIAAEAGCPVSERPFTVDEALHAREAFITAASHFVTPVTAIDGHPIGDGKPGPIGQKLRALYLDTARQAAE